jgi:phytoene desaturase
MKKVIVCGAGIGGLVSAAYLAFKGNDVEIFEKNSEPGGKAGEYCMEGFRFDTGPAKLTMPLVIENFFKDIGRSMNDYIELSEVEPDCKYFWSDTTVLNYYSDKEKLSEELTEVFGKTETKNFFRYLNYGKLFYDLTKENFFNEEFKVRNYISKKGLKNFTKFISGRSVNDVSNKFFKNEKLKQVMNRFATFNGSTPYLAPQFFSVVPYIEHKAKSWQVKGGVYNFIRSLESICREMKVKINYGIELAGTEINDKVITKLLFKETEENVLEKTDFDSVVLNFTNFPELIDENYFENNDWSCSGFVMLLGMDKINTELSDYNVLFSDNNEKEFIEVFEKKTPADNMTINISVSKNAGSDRVGESWQVFVNAPFINKTFVWSEENKQIYKNKIIDRIDSFTFLFDESIRNHIKLCEIITPEDFLRKYNSEFGSLYGLSSNSLYTLIKRPKNKSKRFDNLFFTGANSYPGGGVSLCVLSGKIVSGLVDT